MTTFAAALIHYRTRAGWSLTKLAVEAGIYHQAVMRLEAGKWQPKRETVEALAGALGLSPLEADKLRLAAGFAPCDLVGLVEAGCRRVSGDDEAPWPSVLGSEAAWRLQVLGRTDLNAICRQVTP